MILFRSPPSAERIAISRSRAEASDQRQIRDVRAANQQDHAHGGQQHVQRLFQILVDKNIGITLNNHAPAFVGVRIILRYPCADGVHLFARSLQRHARLELGERDKPMKVARHVVGFENQRCIELRVQAVERSALGKHADHSVWLAIQPNGLSE